MTKDLREMGIAQPKNRFGGAYEFELGEEQILSLLNSGNMGLVVPGFRSFPIQDIIVVSLTPVGGYGITSITDLSL